MSIINMTPEVLQAVNHLCEAGNVDCIIGRLQYAEDELQKTAYEEKDGSKDGLFRVAFDLREIRKEFENLEKLLGYEPERDK